MSVPTTYFAASGYASSMASAKSVPLPTEVRPTMNPPTIPIETAMTRSRVLSRPRLEAVPLRCVSALTTNATAPKRSV